MSLYINDKNAYTEWGIFLEDGSEGKLLLPSPMKAYAENNLRSHPGKQVFVDNPQPDDRDVNLTFCITAKNKAEYLLRHEAFINELQSGVIKLKHTGLNKTFRLIMTNSISFDYYDRLGRLAVRFSEPNPKDRAND